MIGIKAPAIASPHAAPGTAVQIQDRLAGRVPGGLSVDSVAIGDGQHPRRERLERWKHRPTLSGLAEALETAGHPQEERRADFEAAAAAFDEAGLPNIGDIARQFAQRNKHLTNSATS